MAQKNKKNFSPYKSKGQGTKQTKSRGHLKAEKIYSVQEANDRLFDIFKNHEMDFISHEQRMKLAKYYRLLMEEQNRQNFTRILNFRDIAIKQFIDCLIITKHYNFQFPLMDVGTGPGLPGIPLKIFFEKEQMYLAEGVWKRVEFLKRVRDEIGLEKLGMFGKNINDSFVYPVRGIITRAVEEINNTLENCFHCLQTGGEIYFMKGPRVDQELEKLDPKWEEFYKKVADIHYSLPHTSHERRLVVYRKIKEAPLKSMMYFQDRDWENDDGKD